MAILTIDPRYCDSYSECSSSNSSFSYGLLTPTSSAGYSTATSRRQSIVSDGQSCSESAFDQVPTSSSDGITTPLETPPPYDLSFRIAYGSSLVAQGYNADLPPQGVQHQMGGEVSSITYGSQIQDGFNSQSSYYAADVPGLDEGFLDDCQHSEGPATGLRSMSRQLMDFPMTFNPTFEQPYEQNEAAHRDGTLDFDLGYANSNLSPSMFLDIGASHNTHAEIELPQTIAPQTTFVDSSISFTPSTPFCEPSQPIFQTPLVKTEDEFYRLPVDHPASP
ncbi:MAG: hypothetical protein Q9224_005260, partial [Gallowayella concinna]